MSSSPESARSSSDEQALSHIGDPESDEAARATRESCADDRRDAAERRVRTAAARDADAHARDVAAISRDQIAALHDRQLAARDAARIVSDRAVTGVDVVLRAAENRRHAAIDRAGAAEGRARAAADREQAALDREHAARDRLHAQADREALLHQLAIAESDALSGARTRATSLADLEHKIDPSRRAGTSLIIAYVVVVGLKAVNDAYGRAAGDELLRRVVHAMRSHMRSYDLIVRIGGDEFLCAMSGATRNDASTRFRSIKDGLAAEPDRCEIKVGFAALSPQDSADELIQRTDPPLRSLHSVERTAAD